MVITFSHDDFRPEHRPLTASAASEIAREFHELLVDRYGFDVDLDAVDASLQRFMADIGRWQRRPIRRIN